MRILCPSCHDNEGCPTDDIQQGGTCECCGEPNIDCAVCSNPSMAQPCGGDCDAEETNG